MKHFFQDLWHDLREKRMWPVAALLVVALVALPVVLSEKRKDPAPAPASANAQPEKLPTIEISDDTVAFSNLQSFKAKDPFKPGQKSSQNLTQNSATVTSNQPGSAGGSSSPGGASSSGGSGGSGGARGGATPAGSGGSSGGGGGGGSGTAPAPSGGTQRVSYSYVTDLSFGRAGAESRYRGLERLEMLPNPENPMLVFLGATRSGGDAVFLVDSSLRQGGEGTCADDACSVLSIGPGAEHRFRTESGREYVLVIERIRRVKAGASSSSARSNASARTAKGRTKSRDERRRGLVSALLVDTETVTTGISSRREKKGR